VGRLTLTMTVIMFLEEEFSRPTREGSGTHMWIATHSLRSPGLDILRRYPSPDGRETRDRRQRFKCKSSFDERRQ